MKTVKAKIDAGCPNSRLQRALTPLSGQDNDKVYPKYPNGNLVNPGSFCIIKDEKYKLDEKIVKLPVKGGIADIFEEVK